VDGNPHAQTALHRPGLGDEGALNLVRRRDRVRWMAEHGKAAVTLASRSDDYPVVPMDKVFNEPIVVLECLAHARWVFLPQPCAALDIG
jgi:hypothetical protein